KRVETALEQCGLVSNRAEGIKPDDFTCEMFHSFLDSLCLRPEIERIFVEIGSKGKPFLSLDQLTDFINRRQRDSRLNEVLYPPLKREQIRQQMEKYQSNASQLERDQISLMGFSRYLGGEENTLTPAQPLPSPQELLGKILIKNKKKHHHRASTGGSLRRRAGDPDSLEHASPLNDCHFSESEGGQLLYNGEEKLVKDGDPRKSIGGEGESDEEEEDEPVAELKKPNSDEGTASSEVNATEEMSTLVNYIEPVKFKSFEKQLSRIYPKGTRVDSSNYMPQLFWNVGCQMLNMGVFEYNGHSGYLLKPEFMRRTDKHFDPFTENIVDGIVANTVKIRVISGQFLTDKKVSVYVEVDLFGLPADTKRKYRTRTSNGNSLDPVWDDETFVFNKVVLPTLASLRIAVFEENGKFLGHRICPVSTIRPGYHYISLKNEMNQPLMLPSLLVYTEAQDYIPNEHQEYAEALTNPIKHVSLLVQRERQLASLMEDNSESVLEQPKEGGRDLEGDAPLVKIPSPLQPVPSPIDDISNLKEDLIATVLANLQAQSIEELKQQKSYQKLLKKQCKELQELQKKHLKKVWALSKEQRSRCSQLRSDTQKRRSQMEKNLKCSMKKNEPAEPVQRQLTALEVELQKRTVQLREEKKELQKILDRKRQNSIIEAKSRDRDKAESEQNEINRKHISDSVALIRRLDEAQSRRQEKLVIGQREVLRHIEEEKPLQDLEAELQRLPEEICQYLQAELESKGLCSDALFSLSIHSSPSSSSGTPSNCSTPTLPLTPNSSAWNRSLDNGIASLVDSSSSSTPVQSEVELTMV
ncbi:unnamed protein product, partial [Coregonus sp. 'balchen']